MWLQLPKFLYSVCVYWEARLPAWQPPPLTRIRIPEDKNLGAETPDFARLHIEDSGNTMQTDSKLADSLFPDVLNRCFLGSLVISGVAWVVLIPELWILQTEGFIGSPHWQGLAL